MADLDINHRRKSSNSWHPQYQRGGIHRTWPGLVKGGGDMSSGLDSRQKEAL
jgi:hypothetical protein